MDYSTRLLEQFVAVAEEGHFTRAARRLSISQPPLTQAIRRLEKTLGVDLFERSTRQVALTAAGQAFLVDARRLLEAHQRAATRVRRIAHGTEGTLHVGFIGGASYAALPRFTRLVAERFPLVRLHLQQHTSAELADMVRAGRLDVALARAPLDDGAELEARVLTDEPLVLAAPASLNLGVEPVALAALRDHPFAMPSKSALPGLVDLITSACRAAGFEPRDGGRADSLPGLLGLVAAGRCVCLVPAEIRDTTVPLITFRDLPDGAPRLRTLALTSNVRADPLVSNMRTVIEELVVTRGE